MFKKSPLQRSGLLVLLKTFAQTQNKWFISSSFLSEQFIIVQVVVIFLI